MPIAPADGNNETADHDGAMPTMPNKLSDFMQVEHIPAMAPVEVG
jgi:hypothetical protein